MSTNPESAKENPAPPAGSPGRRRSSFAELFPSRPSLDSAATPGPGTSRSSGSSMASALSHAQQQSRTRRLSITTLGLSGSPTHVQQTSPFGTLRRGSSTNDARRSSIDESESAIDDTDAVPPMGTASTGVGDGGSKGEGFSRGGGAMSPLGRRFSFGARAYGDVRATSSGPSGDKSSPGGGGGASGAISAGSSPNGGAGSKASSPPSLKSKEGFSWTDSLRTRAERTSVSAGGPGGTLPLSALHNRSRSAAPIEPITPAPVTKPAPKAPDHFQERILKGDFYMD